MIIGVGLDLCDIERMQGALIKPGFLARFFTPHEQAYIAGRGKGAAESLAGLFAAKEAALKALGSGLSLPLSELCISHDALGAPHMTLEGAALAYMQSMGGKRMHISITHTDVTAAAVAILEG